MRYYAEWLDGEYLLLQHAYPRYDHAAVMQRALRYHALFGSTIVLSDVQMIDFRGPIPRLFVDHHFRSFLRERPDFLALVAEPVRSANDVSFGIALKGIERLTNQANKPQDSFEMAVTRLGEPLLRAGSFDLDRYVTSMDRRTGYVGRVIRRFPQYRGELVGLMHAVGHFADAPLPTTTTASSGRSERYDTLLANIEADHRMIHEAQATRIQNILQIQQDRLPNEQHGRRAAMRKVLGTGAWQHESWTSENLRLYLDVVHAWNCAINRAIAPEAGTLYESRGDLPLSRYERSVTDAVGWISTGPMPVSTISDRIWRFLSWDPLSADWNQIASLARGTQESAKRLQAALSGSDGNERVAALEDHASYISERLVGIPTVEISPWVWWGAKAYGDVTGSFESELVDVAEEAARDIPFAYSALHRKLVVNTIKDAEAALL